MQSIAMPARAIGRAIRVHVDVPAEGVERGAPSGRAEAVHRHAAVRVLAEENVRPRARIDVNVKRGRHPGPVGEMELRDARARPYGGYAPPLLHRPE